MDRSSIDRRGFLVKSAGLGAGLLAGSTVLAACGSKGGGAVTSGATGGAGGGGAAGGANVLRIAQAGAIEGLDPIGPSGGYIPSLQAINACSDTLVRFFLPTTLEEYEAVDRREIFPSLAESWEVSADGRTVRFSLREGVRSSFGNELVAEDVLYTLKRCLNAEAAAAAQLAQIAVTEKSLRVIDERTFEVRTETPQYRILNTLGLYWFGIYDSTEMRRHATDDDPWSLRWAARNTAGHGPYVIDTFRRNGTEVTFKAREDYWGEQPIPRVIYTAVDDASSRLQLVVNGEAHYTEDLSPLQLETVSRSPNAKVATLLSTDGCRLFITWERPFDDVEIRQAIAKALPYQEIIDSVYRGFDGLRQQMSIVPPFARGYTEEFGYAPDVEAARAVLSRIEGAKLEFVHNGDSDVDRQIAILVQTALNAVGLDVSLKALPFSQFQTETREKKWPTCINTTDAPSVVDPIYSLQAYLTELGNINFTRYRNPEIERIVADLNADPFGDEREELVRRGQEIAMRDLPMYPLVWAGDRRGVGKTTNVPGGHGATGVAYFKDMRFGDA